MTTPSTLRIATRESALALAQSEWIAAQLRTLAAGAQVSLLGMTTRGDQILDQPLAQIGGKGLFIKELEVALAERRAEVAVHSMKDMPMTLADGFAVMVVGAREDVRDALVSNHYADLEALPVGAVVGTSSLRRESTLRHFYPHLQVRPLRGNVNTRLRKLDEGEFDAIILASAGLKRLGFADRIRAALDPTRFIPAIAQGALGVEFCADRHDLAALLVNLTNPQTDACIEAERAFGRRLTASCDVPLGALASLDASGAQLTLAGFIAHPDGSGRLTATQRGATTDAALLGEALAEVLLARGGQTILDRLTRR